VPPVIPTPNSVSLYVVMLGFLFSHHSLLPPPTPHAVSLPKLQSYHLVRAGLHRPSIYGNVKRVNCDFYPHQGNAREYVPSIRLDSLFFLLFPPPWHPISGTHEGDFTLLESPRLTRCLSLKGLFLGPQPLVPRSLRTPHLVALSSASPGQRRAAGVAPLRGPSPLSDGRIIL